MGPPRSDLCSCDCGGQAAAKRHALSKAEGMTGIQHVQMVCRAIGTCKAIIERHIERLILNINVGRMLLEECALDSKALGAASSNLRKQATLDD